MKRKIKNELDEKKFRVTIFGSARSKKGDKEYKEIYNLAKDLGDRGIEVITGGGPGIMEAAIKGHKDGKRENKNHSIGLAIKLPHEQKIPKEIDIVKKFDHFSSRLDNFMLLSNAIIVAPGGIGTILELFYSWQLVQVNQICHIPIILFGEEWPGLMRWMKNHPLKSKFIKKKDLDIVFLGKTTKQVLDVIDKAHEAFKVGGKDFCLNYDKYKVN